MKKFITGILATLACFACFATGCNKNDTPNSSSQQTIDLSEAQAYAEDYFRSQLINKTNREDFTLENAINYDGVSFPITWTVNVTSGVTVTRGTDTTTIDVDENLSAALQYTLTLTITNPFDSTKTLTVSFNRTVEAAPSKVPAKITQAPVEGTAYKFHIYHTVKLKDLYLNGKTRESAGQPWYLTTTTSFDSAVDIYVEAVENEEGKFYMYHMGEDGNTKTYINAYKTSDNHISNFYETEADMAATDYDGAGKTKWTFDSTHGTMVTTIKNKEDVDTTYYLGCDDDYETVSPQDESENKGCLIEMVDRTTVSAADKIAQTKKELSLAPVYVGAGSLNLASQGITFPDATIAWAIKSGEGAAIADGKLTMATAPSAATEIVVTATISNDTATPDTKDLTVKFIPNDVAAIVAAAEGLEASQSFANKVTLTGIVASFMDKGEYSEQYNNVSVNLLVKVGDEYKEIGAYRLGGVGVDQIGLGDELQIEGTIMKHYESIQFGQGCTLVSRTDGTEDDIPEISTDLDTPEKILNAAYALEEGASLDGTYTLTGKILSIDDEYSTQYKNITVTIEIEGHSDKPIKCFRLKNSDSNAPEAAADLAVGDTITVTGSIKNHYGTVEFDSGCTYANRVAGEGGDTDNTPSAPVKYPVAITAAPVVGTEYKLYLYQSVKATNYYFTGAMNGYYFASSEDYTDGVTVKVEEATDGFYMYFDNGSKQYINAVISGTHTNAVFDTTPISVWTYDAELKTMVTTLNIDGTDTKICLGTYGDNYTTFGILKNASAADHIGCLATMSDEAPEQGGDTDTTPEITTLTISEAVAIGEALSENYATTTESYYIEGTIVNVSSTTYGNMIIADDEGNMISFYGLYSADGTVRYDSMTTKPVVGDKVKVLTVIRKRNDVAEAYEPALQIHTANATPAAIYKVLAEALVLSTEDSIVSDGAVTLTIAGKTYTDVTISWASDSTCAVVDNTAGTVTYTLPAEAATVTLTATVTCGETTKTYTFTVSVIAAGSIAPEEIVSATICAANGITNSNVIGTLTQNNVTISSEGAKYYNSGTNIRIYSTNTITFAVASGYKITSIEITCSGSSYTLKDVTLSAGEWATNGSVSTLTVADGAESITLTNNSKDQIRIVSLVVTYEAVEAAE